MPLTPPRLDDRDFESLFKEARSRIPRYVPEWTDWNESDPGITLLQLQSWLAEMIIYRLNQVPNLHYIKFLQLLNVEQRPTRPAQAELTFTLKEKLGEAAVLIEKGRIVGVSARDLPRPVFFETDRAFRAISARLRRVVARNDAMAEDVTQNNNASGRTFLPFGESASVESGGTPLRVLVLGFESPLPFPREEIGLHFFLAEEGGALLAAPTSAHCGPPVADAGAPRLAWEWWDGFTWSALAEVSDGTNGLRNSGQVYFRVPGQIPAISALSSAEIMGPVDSGPANELRYYWLRMRLAAGGYTRPPRIERVLTNTVTASAALTVRDEIVGSSDGLPNQVRRVRNIPVLADPPLELEVDEGAGPQRWEERRDLLNSGPHDAHYVLNRATGELRFGDGRRGRIPLAATNNLIARSYRHGGGLIGNVGAGTISDLATPLPQVETVSNIRPAEGGRNEEPL
jgi:predicted phage baseplate assembly protein